MNPDEKAREEKQLQAEIDSLRRRLKTARQNKLYWHYQVEDLERWVGNAEKQLEFYRQQTMIGA